MSKKELNEKMIETFISNITNSMFNQLMINNGDYQRVKDVIRNVISTDRMFNMNVGYGTIFDMTIDFNDLMNRIIRSVINEIRDDYK